MEPNFVLNKTNSKFFVKMTSIESFRNPKIDPCQDEIRGFKKNKINKNWYQIFLWKWKLDNISKDFDLAMNGFFYCDYTPILKKGL